MWRRSLPVVLAGGPALDMVAAVSVSVISEADLGLWRRSKHDDADKCDNVFFQLSLQKALKLSRQDVVETSDNNLFVCVGFFPFFFFFVCVCVCVGGWVGGWVGACVRACVRVCLFFIIIKKDLPAEHVVGFEAAHSGRDRHMW